MAASIHVTPSLVVERDDGTLVNIGGNMGILLGWGSRCDVAHFASGGTVLEILGPITHVNAVSRFGGSYMDSDGTMKEFDPKDLAQVWSDFVARDDVRVDVQIAHQNHQQISDRGIPISLEWYSGYRYERGSLVGDFEKQFEFQIGELSDSEKRLHIILRNDLGEHLTEAINRAFDERSGSTASSILSEVVRIGTDYVLRGAIEGKWPFGIV